MHRPRVGIDCVPKPLNGGNNLWRQLHIRPNWRQRSTAEEIVTPNPRPCYVPAEEWCASNWLSRH
jgi:hypothetical protein